MSALRPSGRVRAHLDNQLYRTGYFLMIGTGATAVLGVVFWSVAAHLYSPREVGLNAAAISAMTLVSGVSSLGLSAVLIRYLPVAGTSTRRLITGTYVVTTALSGLAGVVVAYACGKWSPSLSFLGQRSWLIGFAVAASATTVFTLQDNVLTGLRAAKWIPLENSAYAVAKLALVAALPSIAPAAGPFVAWTMPLVPAIVMINYLIYRRLIPTDRTAGTVERRTIARMAASNFGGNIFGLAASLYLPVLVADRASAAQSAYFYVPWMFSLSLQLVALNVMTSLTVEAAVGLSLLRRLIRNAIVHTLRLLAPVALVTLVAAPWMLEIFGGDYADAGSSLLRWLTIGAIPNAIVVLGISVGRIEHRGWPVVAPQAVHSILLIGLSAILLPSKGIVVIGIIWTGSQTLLALLMLATVLRPHLLRGMARFRSA